MEQRSLEWYAIKAGKVSAGRVHDIITRTRSGDYTAQRQARLTDILLERLTGELTQIPVTPAMQWGIDMEAAARNAYSAAVGVLIDTFLVRTVVVPAVFARISCSIFMDSRTMMVWPFLIVSPTFFSMRIISPGRGVITGLSSRFSVTLSVRTEDPEGTVLDLKV